MRIGLLILGALSLIKRVVQVKLESERRIRTVRMHFYETCGLATIHNDLQAWVELLAEDVDQKAVEMGQITASLLGGSWNQVEIAFSIFTTFKIFGSHV
jgi:hypothetical protein